MQTNTDGITTEAKLRCISTALAQLCAHAAVDAVGEAIEQLEAARLRGDGGQSPANCRNRLMQEGKAYPKSGCAHCKTGGLTGCPYERNIHSGRLQPAAAGDAVRALLDALDAPMDPAAKSDWWLRVNSAQNALKSALSTQPAPCPPQPSLGWRVRERRIEGELLDCFIEQPPAEHQAYGLEVLGDDYTGFGDVEEKLRHCQMIVAWANAQAAPFEQVAATSGAAVAVPDGWREFIADCAANRNDVHVTHTRCERAIALLNAAAPVAPDKGGEADPEHVSTGVPQGVWYDAGISDFWNASTGKRLSESFRDRWYARRAEFPTTKEAALAPRTGGED